MREQLKIYLDSVFASAAKTKRNNDLREEILANLYDKYDGYVADGDSPEEAYRKTIAGIGDLSSLFERLEKEEPTASTTVPIRIPLESDKQRESYPAIRAILLAGAIFLYILSFVPVIIWPSAIAPAMMFLMIAIGTGMILSSAIFRTHTVSADIGADERKRLKRVHTLATLILAAAVMGYILCVCPILIFAELLYAELIGVAGFFVMIALSTVALILRSTLLGEQLAKIDDENTPKSTPQQKKTEPQKTIADKIFAIVSGLYWLAVVCLYFIFSIITNRWGTSWMIFILALLFHGIVHGIFRLVSRKGTAGPIVKIVICSILFVALLPLGVGFSLSELPHISFNLETYNDVGFEYGNATLTETNIEELDIDWTSGTVTVRYHEGTELVIREHPHGTQNDIWDMDDQLRYRVEGSRLTIKQSSPAVGIFFGKKDEAKDLEILLPTTVSLTEFSLDNVSAEVTLSDLRNCRTIDVETVSGNVTLNGCTATEINLSGVSGTLRLNDCEATEWDTETVSGEIHASLVNHPIGIDLETVSGSVYLTLPADLPGFTLTGDTVSGTLEIGYACDQTGDPFRYGNGSTKIDFEAVSGDLILKPAT